MRVNSKYVVEISLEEEVPQEFLPHVKELYENDSLRMLEIRDKLECELCDRFGGVIKVKSQVITSDLGTLRWGEENGSREMDSN